MKQRVGRWRMAAGRHRQRRVGAFPISVGSGCVTGPTAHHQSHYNKWQHGDGDEARLLFASFYWTDLPRGSFVLPCQSGSVETWRADEYCSKPCSPDSAWLRYLAQWAGDDELSALGARENIAQISAPWGKAHQGAPRSTRPREPGPAPLSP